MGVEDITGKQGAVQGYMWTIGPDFAFDVRPYLAYAKSRATLAEVVEKARAANGQYAASLPQDLSLITFKGLLDDAGFRRPIDIARRFSLFPTDAKILLEGLVTVGRAESLQYEGKRYYVSWRQDVIDQNALQARERRAQGNPYNLTSYVDAGEFDERRCSSSLVWLIPDFVKRQVSNVGTWVFEAVHRLVEQNRPLYSRPIQPYALPREPRSRE